MLKNRRSKQRPGTFIDFNSLQIIQTRLTFYSKTLDLQGRQTHKSQVELREGV